MPSKNPRRFSPNNCAVRQFTADRLPVGRCYCVAVDGRCPIHGDVREVQKHYLETGNLTDETKLHQDRQ